jgi:hypothetical protein
VLLGDEADPGREVLPDRNAFWSATPATSAVANIGPTPSISSSRRLASLVRHQALMIRSNSRICAFKIGGNTEQLFDTMAPYRRDDPKLRKMSTDGIDH